MSVLAIENAARQLAKTLVENFKADIGQSYLVQYDDKGDLHENFDSIFSHCGLYGFRITKDQKSAVAYIGKAEGGVRLRQHLTGKNKDGSVLANSVRNKHKALKAAIASDFAIHLCLYSDINFGKASLSCLEIATAIYAKDDCAETFPSFKHWNERIG
jgi:hypothetical protein